MKISVEALQLNFARSGPLRGQELAQELVTRAKQVGSSARKVLEASCLADLEKYLENELSRKISMTQIEYIYAAALAGGAYAAENLPSRVRKISPELAGDELVQICCEIEALISGRKSTIDSIRTTVNSITTIFGDLIKDTLISESDQKKVRFREFEEKRTRLLNKKVADYEEFYKWIDESIIFYRLVSEYRSEELSKSISSNSTDSGDLISAKRKKGFVSTKSIDTYEKRIGDFVSEFVVINKKENPLVSNSILEAIKPYYSYTPSLVAIRNLIEENMKENSRAKYLQYVAIEGKSIIEEHAQELEHFIDDRAIKISYSNKIMTESIDQVLNSLRAQLASKRLDGKAKHRVGNSFLSIEVPGIKKGDIEEIATVLRLTQKK
jgi:CRISPR/Cas system-associated protein Cas5 (RAMP superfamily)